MPFFHLRDFSGIIAIHGLQRDWFGTWTHQNGTNWLSQLLPLEMGTESFQLPKARVRSVTYDLKILGGKDNGMEDFVRLFLQGLSDVRARYECRGVSYS